MYPLRFLSLPAHALLLACAGTTRAAEIYLEDGSIIVGTIELLEDGEDLVVDTKYMDDVVIDWDAIERIEGTADESLSQSGRIRVQFDSSLSTDLLGDLDFKLTYYNRYNNQPPVDVGEFDYGVTLALGYDF